MKNASQDIKDFVNLFLPNHEDTLRDWSNRFLEFLVKNKFLNQIALYHIWANQEKYVWIANKGFQMSENNRRGFLIEGYFIDVLKTNNILYVENQIDEGKIPARHFDNSKGLLYIPVFSNYQKIVFIIEIAIKQNSEKESIVAYFNNLKKLLTHTLDILLEKDILEKEVKNLLAANVALETSQEALHENAVKSIKIHEKLTDSIRYAQKMQEAILPNEALFESVFAEYFIIYQPKDIVSGRTPTRYYTT